MRLNNYLTNLIMWRPAIKFKIPITLDMIFETSNIKAGNRGCLTVKNDTNAYTLRIVKNNVPQSFFITAKGSKNKSSYDGRLRHKVVSVEYTDRYEKMLIPTPHSVKWELECELKEA